MGRRFFEIAEDDAVPVVGKGPPSLDQGERLPCFPGQLADGDGVDNPLVAAESKCASNRQPEDEKESAAEIGIGMT